MREIEERAIGAFREVFGEGPEVVASAPGRVNLIGEHTDYNGGFVLPCAIERRIAVAASRGGNELYSADLDERSPVNLEPTCAWSGYPSGVAWAMREAGYEVGEFRAAFAGDVPRGAGLSSSAALEAATALALDDLFGLGLEDRKVIAQLCQRAENEFVGFPCGIMDQYASLLCERDAALFIDCRSLEAESVPLDLRDAGLDLVVCDTRIEHGDPESGYAARRKTCEAAARALGVGELRDAAEGDLDRLSGEELRRARHIVTENARVLEAVEALKGGDLDVFGGLMYASHRSMRDDFEMSIPEIDLCVEVADRLGASGARLTGAGFGGCAIALVPSGGAGKFEGRIREAFARRGYGEPAFYEFLPAAGAEVAG